MRSFAVVGTLVLVQILAGCGDESSSGDTPRESGLESGTGARASVGGTESGGAGGAAGSGGSDSASAGAPGSGATSGGTSTGGATSGGTSTGGAASGGTDTGGVTTGGANTGGVTTGGTETGGATTGGVTTGGVTTGGISSGGASSGGTAAGGTGEVSPCAVPEGVAEEDLLDLTMEPLPAGCGSNAQYGGGGGVLGPITDADTLRVSLGCDDSATFDIDFATYAVVVVVSSSTTLTTVLWATLDGTTLRVVYRNPPFCGGAVPLVGPLGYYLVPAATTELDDFNCDRSSCD